MMFFLKFLFWLSILVLYITYHGYSLMLNFLLHIKQNLHSKDISFEFLPQKVTVLLTVYNEANKVKKRILNILNTNYPKELLNIMVASDGSSDLTHKIVRDFMRKEKNVEIYLLISNERLGKTGTQNKAIPNCSGDIIIITDADTEFTSTTIQNLVAPFYDSNVGCVSGRIVFNFNKSNISESQNNYWEYEEILRKRESDLGILAVAGGPCMAFRKKFFEDMPVFAGEDCVIPLYMALKGKRNVFNPKAIAFDKMSSEIKEEIATRARMTLRNWMGTFFYKKILNPINYPGYAFSLMFHKILRWLSPFFIIIATLSISYIAYGGEYLFIAYFVLLIYFLGLFGIILNFFNIKAPLISSIFSFFVANYGFFWGFIKLINREKVISYVAGK